MKKLVVIIVIALSLAALYEAAKEAPGSQTIAVNVRALPGIGAR